MRQVWRRGMRSGVSENYMCHGTSAVAVNDNGNVDRVCRSCGFVVCDGGANEPAVVMTPA